MSVSRIVFLMVIVAAAVGLVFASSSTFVLASGSDAGVAIYAAQPLAKLFSLVLFCATTTWALLSKRASMVPRVLAGAIGLAVLAIATHAVVVSFKHSTLEERWMLVRFDRLTFDAADGLAIDWEMKSAFAGVLFHHRRDSRTVYVFTGLGPWRDNFTAADLKPDRM
jgi:hypothetical protein